MYNHFILFYFIFFVIILFLEVITSNVAWCAIIVVYLNVVHLTDYPIFLDTTPLCHHHLVIHIILLDIPSIEIVVTHFIVSSFIGIIYNAVIKCSYECGKLFRKVMTTSLFARTPPSS